MMRRLFMGLMCFLSSFPLCARAAQFPYAEIVGAYGETAATGWGDLANGTIRATLTKRPTGWKTATVYWVKDSGAFAYFVTRDNLDTAKKRGYVVEASDWSEQKTGDATTLTCPSKSGFGALVICYEPFVYSVAFAANGGTGTMGAMTGLSYTNTTTKLTANAFARMGYAFAGWSLNEAGTGTTFADQATVGGAKFSVTADGQTVNLFAQWMANAYTVTYNANGGTAGASRPTSATYDTAFQVSAPTWTGYTFEGWKVSGHDVITACWGTGESSVSMAVADNLIETTGDVWLKNLNPTAGATVTLTAQWTAMTCTVTFSKESGSDGTSSLAIKYGQTSTEFQTIEPPKRDHYTFLGYYTTASGSPGVCYFDADGRLQRTWDIAETDCTLYARWQAETYVVSFSPNDGKGEVNDRAVTYYEEFALPDGTALTAPSDERVFGGWALSADAARATFLGGDSTSVSANSSYLSGKKLTFYAYWRDNARKIQVNANGGTASSNSFVVVIGQHYDARGPLPTATWTNGRKLFTGWYTAATDGTRIGVSDTVPDNPPTTLYAYWTNAAYVVRFDGNGAASGTMVDQTLYFDTPTELASNAFARTGYTFAGWATTNAPTHVAYADGATVTDLATYGGETTQLLAVWTTNTYYVTFDANGGSGTMPTLTNRYDQAFTLPQNRFTRNGFWTFAGWAKESAPKTVAYEDGAEVKNLTATAGATVTLKAVWQTSLSSLSQAMHCDNLDWKNTSNNGTYGIGWETYTGEGVGHGTSSCVRQANSGTGNNKKSYLTASLGTSVTGVKGTLSFWWKPTGDGSVLGYSVNTSEASMGSDGTRLTFLKGQWTNVVIRVDAQGSSETYVHFVNATTNGSDGYCLIDGMTWTPDGAHPMPGADDAVEVTDVTVTDGNLSLSFTGNAQFSYHLLATDSLSPAVWYDFGATNVGTGVTQTFEIPIDTTQSQRFFKIKTIQTLDE